MLRGIQDFGCAACPSFRRDQVSRLKEAYLQASRRLARLIQDEDRISAASGISDIAKSLLQTLDEIAASEEDPPCSPGILE